MLLAHSCVHSFRQISAALRHAGLLTQTVSPTAQSSAVPAPFVSSSILASSSPAVSSATPTHAPAIYEPCVLAGVPLSLPLSLIQLEDWSVILNEDTWRNFLTPQERDSLKVRSVFSLSLSSLLVLLLLCLSISFCVFSYI